MSDIAVTWAKAQTILDLKGEKDRNAKDVLVYLASYADAHGEAWAAVSILAFEMNVDDRTVRRGLAALRCKPEDVDGLIEETGRSKLFEGKLYPLYRLRLDRGPANTREALRAAREAARAEPSPDTGVRGSAEPGVTPASGEDDGGEASRDTGVRSTPDTGVTQIGKLKGNYTQEASPPEGAQARAGGEGSGSGLGFWPAWNRIGEIMPRPMRVATKWKLAKSAWSKVARKVGHERLVAAMAAFAADPAVAKRDILPGLDVWLRDETFLGYLPNGEAATAARLAEAAPAPMLAGAPADVLDLVLSRGEDFARSYLTGATWDEARQAIVCARQIAADKLRDRLGQALRARRVMILGPAEMPEGVQ